MAAFNASQTLKLAYSLGRMTICEDEAVTVTPPAARKFPTCMYSKTEACSVAITAETRDMVLGNLNSTKCTVSGTNTSNAYSVRYTSPSKTNVQSVDVFQDDIYATSSTDDQHNVEIDMAVIGDLKTFEYNFST